MSRRIHVHLDVAGVLATWRDRDLEGLLIGPEGGRLSAGEARAALQNELAEGRRALPLGDPCEGFDYSGGGCPGHEIPAEGGGE